MSDLIADTQPPRTAARIRGTAAAVTSGFSAFRAVSQLRDANEKRDRLLLVNAFANLLVFVTASLLAVRELRKGKR